MSTAQISALMVVVSSLLLGELARSSLSFVLCARLRGVPPVAAGWYIMWRLVLSKIPIVRALCDLPELPASKADKADKKKKRG